MDLLHPLRNGGGLAQLVASVSDILDLETKSRAWASGEDAELWLITANYPSLCQYVCLCRVVLSNVLDLVILLSMQKARVYSVDSIRNKQDAHNDVTYAAEVVMVFMYPYTIY